MDTSVVICAYDMERELPRTIQSLSPTLQRGVENISYDLLVADNGSPQPVQVEPLERWGAQVSVFKSGTESRSPVPVLNEGITRARGELIGAMVDGARLASPGVIGLATAAARLHSRAIVLTLGFHLGPDLQNRSVQWGYNEAEEDRLLAECGWADDPYRLFGISALAASSSGGWFCPINESNAIFMRRELWAELGGFDHRFTSPGGGFANLDLLDRAAKLPNVKVVTLLGEGTFHQVHGGIATNAPEGVADSFYAEYEQIRGRPFRTPAYDTVYLGAPELCLTIIERGRRSR